MLPVRIARYILPALLIFAAASVRAAPAYLAEIDDLPLAPGLTEQAGGTLFDTPAGRIVEAAASGFVTAATVSDFYAKALPDLGWSGQGGGYERDGEVLHIAIDPGAPDKDHPTVTVHFSLAPETGTDNVGPAPERKEHSR